MTKFYARRWSNNFGQLESADAGIYAAILIRISENNGPIDLDYGSIAGGLRGVSAADAEKSIERLCNKCFLFMTPDSQLMDWTAAEAMHWRPLP